jgi:hypothetical protein
MNGKKLNGIGIAIMFQYLVEYLKRVVGLLLLNHIMLISFTKLNALMGVA